MYASSPVLTKKKSVGGKQDKGEGKGLQAAILYGLEGFGPLSTNWSGGFLSIFPHKMIWYRDGLPWASGA